MRPAADLQKHLLRYIWLSDHDLQPGLCFRDYFTYSKQFLDTVIHCFDGEVSLD